MQWNKWNKSWAFCRWSTYWKEKSSDMILLYDLTSQYEFYFSALWLQIWKLIIFFLCKRLLFIDTREASAHYTAKREQIPNHTPTTVWRLSRKLEVKCQRSKVGQWTRSPGWVRWGRICPGQWRCWRICPGQWRFWPDMPGSMEIVEDMPGSTATTRGQQRSMKGQGIVQGKCLRNHPTQQSTASKRTNRGTSKTKGIVSKKVPQTLQASELFRHSRKVKLTFVSVWLWHVSKLFYGTLLCTIFITFELL